MKAPRASGLGERDRIDQRPLTNGLEDMALFWYGDALAMQGASESMLPALTHMTVMQCATPSNRWSGR